MENLIEAIRTALRDDAEPIARRAGLVACRKILAVLETATANEPPAAPTAAPESTDAAIPPSEIAAPSSASTAHVTAPASAPASRIDPAGAATMVASLGKLPPEQLLDLMIARLRAALPPGTSVPSPPSPLRFQIVPLHHLERLK